MRQLCPQTCGCSDPRGPLALSLPEQGCGEQCVRSGVYRAALDDLPCEDVPKSDPGFLAFLDRWDDACSSWPLDWQGGLRAGATHCARLVLRFCVKLGAIMVSISTKSWNELYCRER